MKRSRIFNVIIALVVGFLLTIIVAEIQYRTTDHGSCDACGAAVDNYGWPLSYRVDSEGAGTDVHVVPLIINAFLWSIPPFIALTLLGKGSKK